MDKHLDALEHRMRPGEAFRRAALKTAETTGTLVGRGEVLARRLIRRWRGTPA